MLIECKVMEPVIIPIAKLYRLIRDAVILITNTHKDEEDCWQYRMRSETQIFKKGCFTPILVS
eukprot:scaffold1264_cov263-Chaetoceros_neogracile.AAC.2